MNIKAFSNTLLILLISVVAGFGIYTLITALFGLSVTIAVGRLIGLYLMIRYVFYDTLKDIYKGFKDTPSK